MHIVLAGDQRMISGMELVIFSTMKYNRDVRWHIFTMDCEVDHKDICQIHVYKRIPQETLDWFNFMIKFMDAGSELTVHDCIEPYHDYLENSVNAYTSFSPYAGLRLVSDVVLEGISNCLYLDSDVIVQADLGWMYSQYTQMDCDYAAYVTPGACEGWGEMISGVVVFNLDRIRRSGFLERARNNYNRFQYQYPDQTAMAKAGDPEKLPETYDYIDDHKMAPYKPAILHFTNANKCKIYTVPEGEFYRYYPEHLHLKEGMDVLREVYQNYEHCMSPDLKHDYRQLKCLCHTQRELAEKEAAEKASKE